MTTTPGWLGDAMRQVGGPRNRWTRGFQHAACGLDDWARINAKTAGGGTRWSCRPCRARGVAAWRAALFPRVLAHYGGRCVECGEADPDTLVVDHINDDGADQRRALAIKLGYADGTKISGQAFYAELVRQGFPADVQILCANHNLKKERMRQRALKEQRKMRGNIT